MSLHTQHLEAVLLLTAAHRRTESELAKSILVAAAFHLVRPETQEWITYSLGSTALKWYYKAYVLEDQKELESK